MSEKISIEKCLNVVPNKFELTVLAMNRARDLLMGAVSEIETGKYTKKQVNKALKEIELQQIDLNALREKIKKNILNNNLFLKDVKQDEEDSNVDDGDDLNDDLDLKDDDLTDDDDDNFDLSDVPDDESLDDEK